MRGLRIVLPVLLLIASHTYAQIGQVVRGKVVDKVTLTGLPGASLMLSGENDYGTVTDSTGSFRLENVPAGRYQLEARFLGYKAYVLGNLRVNAGKSVDLIIELDEDPQNLDEVVVRATDVSNDLDAISTRTFTVEETQRFAASFYDPARLVAAYPGVVTANDQTNNISIRGHSPNSLRWWLEGVEIVNPNHTSNAGTLSDKPTTNGGGVNILSAQMLANSNFITGGFSPRFGNVTSGVLDMKLRDGNREDHEFVAQASLLGLDFAAEGPLSKKAESSFLVNYRYSTVGILSGLGVDFGGESISFQDLSFNLSFPLKKGSVNLFGVGGMSQNYFSGPRDSTEWADEKSTRDINFDSRFGAAGINLTTAVSTSGSLYGTVVWSGLENKREAFPVSTSPNLTASQYYDGRESKTAVNLGLLNKIGQSGELDMGAHLVIHRFAITDLDFAFNRIEGSASNLRVAPYAEFNTFLFPRLNISVGAQGNYYSMSSEILFEPRVNLKYQMSRVSNLRVSYGLYSQAQLPETLLRVAPAGNNRNLEVLKSHQFVAGYYTLFGKWKVQAEVYYHSLFDVAIENSVASSYSVINDVEVPRPISFTNEGTGSNYGLDMSIERLFSDGFYWIVSGSVFESLYTAGDQVERDTRYNTNYAINLSGGKEFYHKEKNRTLGINGRFYYIGGLRDTPVNPAASAGAGRTVYFESQAFSIQNEPYLRFDLRLSTTRQKPNYTRMIALDIQNVFNRQNQAFRYYDTYLEEVVISKQLGIIPVITYRVEF